LLRSAARSVSGWVPAIGAPNVRSGEEKELKGNKDVGTGEPRASSVSQRESKGKVATGTTTGGATPSASRTSRGSDEKGSGNADDEIARWDRRRLSEVLGSHVYDELRGLTLASARFATS
jgi:hypothetical protein